MKVTVRQIPIVSKPESTFYLKIEWATDLGTGFVALLCDGLSAWSGEVSEEDVTREAKEMKIQREKYVHDLQLALTGEGQESQSYIFHLTPQQIGSVMAVRLSYEKIQRDIAFTIGRLELLPIPEPTEVIRELISYGLNLSVNLQTEKQLLYVENQKLMNVQEHLTTEMERYVQEKESLERDLYSRFVLILNKKKFKICALEEKVKQLHDAIEAEKESLKKGRAGHEKCENTDKICAKGSDYGDATDEEDLEHNVLKPNGQEVLASISKSDCLNDVADVAPNRKRRQRHFQPLESKTKRQAVMQLQTMGYEQTEEAKSDAGRAPLQQPAHFSPDQLFEDF